MEAPHNRHVNLSTRGSIAMSATFTFDQNRSEGDWEVFLFEAILDQPRTLTVSSGTGLDSVTVQNGNISLNFISDGSDLSVAGSVLTGGTINAIELQRDGENVFHLTGIAVAAAAVATLLSEGADTGRHDNFQAVFASVATTFNGPPTGAISAFGSVFDDSYDLSDGEGTFNYIWTNGGDDSVFGSSGEDFIDNSAATEGLTIDFAAGTIETTEGGAPLGHFDEDVEDVAGSNFDDVFLGDDRLNNMFGNAGDDSFEGGGDNDYFEPGDGTDTVDGGDDFDKISYRHDGDASHGIVLKFAAGTGSSGTVVDGFGNTDTFTNIEAAAGGDHNDKLTGNDADNNLEGEGGKDAIKAGKGDDYLNGGNGNDTLDGGQGNDFFEGGGGKDKYVGGGGQGPDDNDYWDKVSFESEDGGQGIVVTYKDDGTATIIDTYGNEETATGIEQFKGSRYKDKFNGSANNDSAEGMDGADTFDMGGGWDEVQYQNEQDGGGSHGVIVNLSDAKISANIGFGKVSVGAGRVLDTFGKMDKLISVERVDGSHENDYMVGGNGNGDLNGNDGNDKLFGQGGEDDITGGNGKDTIEGGRGNDHMDGLAGKDVLTGGKGADDFNFGHMGKANADTITDFKTGEDQIWLWDGAFGLGSGEQLANKQFLAADGATEATKGAHRVVYDTDSGKLYVDLDGKDGDDAVLVAILKGGVELHASDIQLG